MSRNRIFWYSVPDAEAPLCFWQYPHPHGYCVGSLGDGESVLPSMSRADVIKAFPAYHRAYGTC